MDFCQQNLDKAFNVNVDQNQYGSKSIKTLWIVKYVLFFTLKEKDKG